MAETFVEITRGAVNQWIAYRLTARDATTGRIWIGEAPTRDDLLAILTKEVGVFEIVREDARAAADLIAGTIMRRLARERLDGARARQTVGDITIMTGDARKVCEMYDATFAYLAVAQDEPEGAWVESERELVVDLAATYLRWQEIQDEPEDAWVEYERELVIDLAATYLRWQEIRRGC